MQTVRAHYQNKMDALKRMLALYQGKVEQKNTDWHNKVLVHNPTTQHTRLARHYGYALSSKPWHSRRHYLAMTA